MLIMRCVIHYTVIFLWLTLQLCGEGLDASTLVRTATGYTSIEHLQKNDVVVAYDFEKHLFIEQKITAIQFEEYPTYVKLTFDNHSICVAPDQQLYNPVTQQWLYARQLTPSDVLLCNGDCYFSINKVERISKKRILYSISVDNCHNFCITPLHIHVHNFAHVILAAAPIVTSIFSGAMVTLVAPPIGVGILGAIVSFFINKKKKATSSFGAAQVHVGRGGGVSPPEDPDKNKSIFFNKIVIKDADLRDITSNKSRHVFDAKHHLEKIGNTRNIIIDKIINATKKAIQEGKIINQSEFKIHSIIDGYQVEIRGIVINNELKFGTFFVVNNFF